MRKRERLNLSREEINDITNSVQQLRQRWDHKLVFPISELGERYLRMDLGIILDCSLSSGEFCGGQRFPLAIRHYTGNARDRSPRRKEDIGACCDDQEFPVFIKSVHVVDNAKGIIDSIQPPVVGLQLFNQRKDPGIINALYLSVVSGLFFFRQRPAKDREFKHVLVIPPCGSAGKVPDDMVKAGAKVMNDLTSQYTEAPGDLQGSMIVERFFPSLILCIGNDWVLAFLEEDHDFAIKIDDILIGPF